MKVFLWFISIGLIACEGPADDPPGTPGKGAPDLFVDREHVEHRFENPTRACISCHPEQVRQWSVSSHAYAAIDPVFHAMVRVGQEQTKGKMGQFCVQCHSPAGLALGETEITQGEDGIFRQNLDNLSPAAGHGVTCDVCHTATAVNEPVNAKMVFTPDGTMRARIEDPVPTTAHESQYSELHGESLLCGSCHNVTNAAGALIEETFDEWARSSSAAKDETCQDCHMPTYQGRAATEGPIREVRSHQFVGVDVSLMEPEAFPGYYELRARTEDLLQSSADIHVSMQGDELSVTVDNLAGHRLPSGATAERQMWLQIVVRDEAGQIAFESGTLDARGDLRDDLEKHTLEPGSDPQLVVWRQSFLGDDGQDVTFPWQAKDVFNHLIEPDSSETNQFDLSELDEGRYQVDVRLMFRTFPPYFLRELEVKGGLDEAVKGRLPTIEMAATRLDIWNEPAGLSLHVPCDDDAVLDCSGQCVPTSFLGDGICDDNALVNLSCGFFGADDGDCVSDRCLEGQIEDCEGRCVPEGFLGDGICDLGTVSVANLACENLRLDDGDCRTSWWDTWQASIADNGCALHEVRDCQGVCQPSFWLGDGQCDDGETFAWGRPDFSCAQFSDDRGDCDITP